MLVHEGHNDESSAQSYVSVAPGSFLSLSGRRALVIEDDEMLTRFLTRMLEAEGVQVSVTHDGLAAMQAFTHELDFILLDLNLPGLDGLSVLQQLRARQHVIPVLVLTAHNEIGSVVRVLETGADDCLSKPFAYAELLARVRALLRRQSRPDATKADLASVALSLNYEESRVSRGGRHIDLTPREFQLLEFLLRSPGKAVPRGVLHKELWGEESSSGSNVVDVYMKYLRDKLELPGFPKLVRTVRGVGYAVDEA